MTAYGLHHVQLAIPSGGEALARSFYGGVLGLTEVPKPAALATRLTPGLPAHLDDGTSVRRATIDDLPDILALKVDDVIAAAREHADPATYTAAFHRVDADPASDLVVLVDAVGRVIGSLQLTVIPGVGRGGTTRAQIEAVRITGDRRGQGHGEALMRWVFDRARQRGCGLAQLTSDRQRTDASRFYQRLGMDPSHTGFKMVL
ncbi:MAG: GNAT family N-acetyltransferase [Euzebya sp.]